MVVFPSDKREELSRFIAQKQRAQRKHAQQTLMPQSAGSMLGLIPQASVVQDTVISED